ncbi:hypothetical protein EVAR_17983_1 [Eumeta japonica]|uniref:Uncharacterized protein n=1 Tax=Eumeta variegata TaxID=151549 RepID=A0A4C1UYC2_EUMVA|nr:hypothetical protein EVAR_17983_1 [Eumeta japonica]
MSSGRHHLFLVVFSLFCVVVLSNTLDRKASDDIPEVVPAPSEDSAALPGEVNDVDQKAQAGEPLAPVAEGDVGKPEKKCAEIGEFCSGHSDCCTYACLGYLKRCVSG